MDVLLDTVQGLAIVVGCIAGLVWLNAVLEVLAGNPPRSQIGKLLVFGPAAVLFLLFAWLLGSTF